MDAALRVFSSNVVTAQVALFFYAGHAFQYMGSNYLMPIDAVLMDERDLGRSMVTEEDIRSVLHPAGVKIMILDASRDNPLGDRFKQRRASESPRTRGVERTRGLARIEDRAEGMFVAYAGAAGTVALDGNSTRHSPFSTALLRWMPTPAMEISAMFRRVSNDVLTATGGRQRPEVTSSLTQDFFFDPLADKRIWDRIHDSTDPVELRDFIYQFPSSLHAEAARDRLKIIEDSRRAREIRDRCALSGLKC
jgi:uncharacterized caspase-like protein